MMIRVVLLLLLCSFQICAEEAKEEEVINDPEFHARLLQIAREYKDYGQVNKQLRIAPTLCKAPFIPPPFLSSSKDESTHGKKVYYLYANPSDSYLALNMEKTDEKFRAKAGQVIVKESFVAEKAPKGTLLAGERKGLFILFKMEPETPKTDRGWVYGTVAPDGKTVTSAGKVTSCMNCHQEAPHDRLFGLEPPEK